MADRSHVIRRKLFSDPTSVGVHEPLGPRRGKERPIIQETGEGTGSIARVAIGLAPPPKFRLSLRALGTRPVGSGRLRDRPVAIP